MRTLPTILFLSIILINILLAQDFLLKTGNSGLSLATSTNGVAVADYDLDGDLYVYFVAIEQYDPQNEATWNRLFRNNGDKTFTDVTLEAGVLSKVNGYPWSGMGNKFGAAWGDYDNDGYPDLFLTSFGENELYHNQGDNTFVNVTESAGVAGNPQSHHSSALWWDYDLDGDLDLYVSVWGDKHANAKDAANIMYENLGDGIFSDVSEHTALADTGRTWTSLPIDGNNDGLLDLYVVNDFGRNKFYVNLGDKTFREATAEFGLEDSGNGMGVALGDYDNNGFFDIYLTNIEGLNPSTPNPLFSNTGNSQFLNKSIQMGVDKAGWAWGTEFFDCDHDGDEDLYVVNGFMIEPGQNFFFLNTASQGSNNFLDRSGVSGADGAAEARGLVVFDYDDDGDLDLLVSNFREQPYLYENRTASKNWLKVELEGTRSNRNAFGSRVEVHAGGNTYFRNNNGVEFLGQSILPLHFGLADAGTVDEIVVRWPDGSEERVPDIAVNRTVRIKQGSGLVTSVRGAGSETSPGGFQLLGNYPNPFNGSTIVEFELPQQGRILLTIANLRGQRVKTLSRNFSQPGRHRIFWDGTDDAGNSLGSGFYFYRIDFLDSFAAGRMLYLK